MNERLKPKLRLLAEGSQNVDGLNGSSLTMRVAKRSITLHMTESSSLLLSPGRMYFCMECEDLIAFLSSSFVDRQIVIEYHKHREPNTHTNTKQNDGGECDDCNTSLSSDIRSSPLLDGSLFFLAASHVRLYLTRSVVVSPRTVERLPSQVGASCRSILADLPCGEPWWSIFATHLDGFLYGSPDGNPDGRRASHRSLATAAATSRCQCDGCM